MNKPILEVAGLCTNFYTREGVIEAVKDVSFSLAPGQIIGLVGESGSGKSVTGFSLIGLVDHPGKITAGSIILAGQDIASLPEESLRSIRGNQISMVFQDPMMTLNPVLSISTQMTLAVLAHDKVSKIAARARAIDVLKRVGIPDAAARIDAYPHQFSGGMRQRVAVAIAMLHSPSVIIADEPTTALDVSIQAQILHEMRILAKESDTALIWISHDLSTVSSLADKLLVMYAGRIVEEGPTAQVLRNPHHPYTKGLLNSLPATSMPGQMLTPIPGSPPSLLSLPPGCPFEKRCAYSDEACLGSVPHITQGDVSFRCHHPIVSKA